MVLHKLEYHIGDILTYLKDIIPAHSKSPRRIDESDGICVETTSDRVHNGKFTKSVDNVEHHDTNDHEIDEHKTGSLNCIALASRWNSGCFPTHSVFESITRTHEETSSN